MLQMSTKTEWLAFFLLAAFYITFLKVFRKAESKPIFIEDLLYVSFTLETLLIWIVNLKSRDHDANLTNLEVWRSTHLPEIWINEAEIETEFSDFQANAHLLNLTAKEEKAILIWGKWTYVGACIEQNLKRLETSPASKLLMDISYKTCSFMNKSVTFPNVQTPWNSLSFFKLFFCTFQTGRWCDNFGNGYFSLIPWNNRFQTLLEKT